MGELKTVAQIAEVAECKLTRVERLIRRRGYPFAHRVGITRLFAPETVERVLADLREIDARHGGQGVTVE